MLTPEETNEDIALVDDREIRTHSGSNFLTTLRYNLKKSALGSLFVSYHASLRSDLQDTFGSGVGAHTGIEARTATRKTAQLDDDSAQDLGRHSPYFVSDIAELSTPTLPSRRQSRRISVPDVKAVISSITGSLGRSRSQSNASSVKSVSSSARGTSRPRLFSITASGSTVTDSTPPLTPSSVFSAACPPCADKPGFPRTYESTPGAEEDEVLSRESLLTSVKEGKKPERSICYDELIADISNDYMQSSPQQQQSDSFDEDSEEWFGLEYTLEISKRDQGAIARASVSAGEYSKSRASWAAMRSSLVHPMFQDQAYQRWRKWHRYLDRQEEIRRIQEVTKFGKRAQRRAEIYVKERRIRKWVEQQKEETGSSVELKQVMEGLAALAQHRPDPYFPPRKHNIAWLLKRSRSSACLRELLPIPEVQ